MLSCTYNIVKVQNSRIKSLGDNKLGYRNEVGVILQNTGSKPYKFSYADRIAQMVVKLVPFVGLQVVEELDDTERGQGGFGSTGQ